MQIKEVFAPPQIITVQRLADEIWNEYYPPIIGQDQVDYMLETLQTAKAVLQQINEGHQYFLLGDESNPVGYMAIKRQNRCLFLSKLYIQKSHRQKGYAKDALEFLKDIVKKERLRTITLTVNKGNTTAITTYEKLGFVKTGSLVQDIGNGYKMDDFSFELPY